MYFPHRLIQITDNKKQPSIKSFEDLWGKGCEKQTTSLLNL